MSVLAVRAAALVLAVALLAGTAGRALPSVSAQTSGAPDALLGLLANRPMTDEELPAGVAVAGSVSIPEPELLLGAIGGMRTLLEIPDPAGLRPARHRIDFHVFGDPAAAERASRSASASAVRRGGAVSDIAGLDRPASLLASTGFDGNAPAAAAVCLVQSSFVLIAALSVLGEGAAEQAAINAVDLAQAAAGHLDDVIADADSATPPSTQREPSQQSAILATVLWKGSR